MEQLTIFEVMEKMKQPPRPDPADPLSLPGFAKVKAYLEGKGLPWEWIIKIPDTSDKYTIYLKHGRPSGERKPAIKTSPKWCPMRPENQKEEKDHE